ncbi:hypothetical protein JNUCC1_01711 [Lentibacillus sp. JNUCC-1]|uniref:hypothetical protein n=1 Tax=Lentibacillus sp. JNUCC-1 TaxID=2654513 RepID=UPI0012E8A358|nr:hypothetical protein [Lentibacillus sp. JNUCC-1]MUV37905.1 hypothetical protein [Lentibacillus sp. JNUCC-1]
MKQIIMGALFFVVMTLAACQSGNDNGNNDAADNQTADNNAQTEENTDMGNEGNSSDQAEGTEEDTNEDNAGNAEETGEQSEVAQMEEYSTIESEVDVDGLTSEVVEDNPNKRVILFKDGDREAYKSIFIKNEKRLKIIGIEDDEGQVYNEIIE